MLEKNPNRHSITLWRENDHKKMMIVWNIYYHISGKMHFSEYVHGQQRRTLLAVKAPQRSRAVWPPCGFCKLNKIYRRGENYLQRNFVFASSVKTTIRPEVSSALCRDERSGGGGRPRPPPSSSSLCPRASPPAGVLFVLGCFFFTLKITTAAFYISLREADSAAGTSVWIKLKTRSNLVLALTCGLRQASDWLLPKKKSVCVGGGGWVGRVKFAEADFTFRLMQRSPWGSCEYIKDVY